MQPDNSALVLGPACPTPAPVADAPRLSAASAVPLREITAVDERGAARSLQLPIERPLSIVVDGHELVTLLTLGAAPEWLVLGYLHNQRLIDEVAALQSIDVDWTKNIAHIVSRLKSFGESARAAARTGNLPGCALGTGFGDLMRRLDAGAAQDPAAQDQAARDPAAQDPAAMARAAPSIAHAEILAILDCMRQHDAIHRAAGSVHSCALFQRGELWVAVEDVSRHNGMDTIAGFMALHGVHGADKALFTTGRLTGEMVMKAAHNGIFVMISRNGTTALGFELAAKLGMTLIGRAANQRYVCFIGAERIARDPGT